MGLLESAVATSSHRERVDGLGDGAFHSGPFGIPFLEGFGLLARLLQRLMFLLNRQGDLTGAGSVTRPLTSCAPTAGGTRLTMPRVKHDQNLLASTALALFPIATHFAFGTCHPAVLPVNLKLRDVERTFGTSLPAVIRTQGTHQVDAILLATIQHQVSSSISRI